MIRTLVFAGLFYATQPALAGVCEIRGITFQSDVKAFLSTLKPSEWKGDYAEIGIAALDACKAYWKVNSSALKKSADFSFIDGLCPLRGEPRGPFGFLNVDWKNGKVREVKLNYHEHENKVNESTALKELTLKFGKEKSSIKYNEEAFEHTLRLWKTNECVVVFDSGALAGKPSEAIFLHFFPPNYSPSEGDPMKKLFQ